MEHNGTVHAFSSWRMTFGDETWQVKLSWISPTKMAKTTSPNPCVPFCTCTVIFLSCSWSLRSMFLAPPWCRVQSSMGRPLHRKAILITWLYGLYVTASLHQVHPPRKPLCGFFMILLPPTISSPSLPAMSRITFIDFPCLNSYIFSSSPSSGTANPHFDLGGCTSLAHQPPGSVDNLQLLYLVSQF